ncbi:hypothetical protein FAY30_23325 [Bacillus sp. S3]|uniref:hypothetical protein n=1 Tax=Bacillus sp. S3 TaxID=486398 RepID=UPI00118CCD7E|nr:hypothetical protein [Bacillus sp. S3]QCJ44585.1 hypothetical protein FAY30_23325 [Bacillus sp. S3]
MKSKFKTNFRIVLVMLVILLLTVMVSTSPSEAQFESWTLQKLDIKCEKFNHWCVKDGKEIETRSGMFAERIIFNIFERDFEYENGRIITFWAVGIFGNCYEIKDGRLWGFLAFGV